MAGSLDYGFEPLTLNLATILHHQYQSAGLGLSRNMGAWGALEVSAQMSRSVFDNHENLYRFHNDRSADETPEEKALNDRNDWLWHSYGRGYGHHASGPQTGISATVKYAKSLGDKTNLHLLTWRYTGEKFVDFSGFDPTQVWLNENRKERYEAVISQGTVPWKKSASGDSVMPVRYWKSCGPGLRSRSKDALREEHYTKRSSTHWRSAWS